MDVIEAIIDSIYRDFLDVYTYVEYEGMIKKLNSILQIPLNSSPIAALGGFVSPD